MSYALTLPKHPKDHELSSNRQAVNEAGGEGSVDMGKMSLCPSAQIIAAPLYLRHLKRFGP